MIEVFVPCANGGAGEIASLAGTLHEVFHISFDAAGGVHFKLHDQPQGISGFGRTTGLKYQATGVTQQQLSTNPATFVNNFRIIGQGPEKLPPPCTLPRERECQWRCDRVR